MSYCTAILKWYHWMSYSWLRHLASLFWPNLICVCAYLYSLWFNWHATKWTRNFFHEFFHQDERMLASALKCITNFYTDDFIFRIEKKSRYLKIYGGNRTGLVEYCHQQNKCKLNLQWKIIDAYWSLLNYHWERNK